MKKKIATIIAVVLLSFSQLKAQLNEIGINVGLVASRYTVGENFPNDFTIISQGRISTGYTAGAQWMIGPPKDQNSPYLKLEHAMMVEANFSRVGGNINLQNRPAPPNKPTSNELTFVNYQVDVSAMYMAKLNRFYMLIGAGVTNHLFRGVKVGAANEFRSANNQLSEFYFSSMIGLGVRVNRFLITSRYQLSLTEFGSSTALIPTDINSHQLRIGVAYFLIEKHRGKNWGSIYYD